MSLGIEKTKLDNVKNIIVVASGKGGVGKSTVAANLCITLARQGYQVGLLDADIYGPSIPKMFAIEDEQISVKTKGEEDVFIPVEKFGIKMISIGLLVDNSQAVIWRGPMAANALAQLFSKTDWGELDYLVVDFPPGTGDIQISAMQQFEITGAIVVTTPQVVAVNDARKGAEMFSPAKMNVPLIGIVENMAWFTPKEHPDEKYFLFGNGGGSMLAKEFNTQLLAQIPLIQDVDDSTNDTVLLSVQHAPVLAAFERIADAVVESASHFRPKSNLLVVAIPTVDGKVDDHFGHCDHYTVFEIGKNQSIENEFTVPSGDGCGCKSNIASVLSGLGVKMMLAGNMGEGAKNVLNDAHIQVIRGCQGDIHQVLNDFLNGKLSDSGIDCESHEHECANH